MGTMKLFASAKGTSFQKMLTQSSFGKMFYSLA